MGAGRLAPGELLPPMRELAVELGVNPNTVAAAYRTLRDRGVIETAGRRGSRVRSRPASTPRESIAVQVPEGVRDAASGNPDPALLPPLEQALAAAVAEQAGRPVLYGAPAIDSELERMARAAFAADGVPDGPVAAASGALDAMERALFAHLRPGDPVAVEDPGWGSLLDLVSALGLRAVPVPVDDDGPLPEVTDRVLGQGARALVVTDRAQNPTGAAIGEQRARELRTVLSRHRRTLLIEDDHGHGIVGFPLHPLAGATDHWMLVRSFAKVFGPDLRLALFTGDALTVDRVRGRLRLGPGWVSHLLQDAVLHLWRTGTVDYGEVAASYNRRRQALIRELAERGLTARGRSGMNVWLPVADETGVVAGLLRSGWAVAPGARFRLAAPPGIRLTVSALAMEEIPALADAVAAATAPLQAGRYA